MEFESAFKTDIGRKRKQNQDNGIALPELGLFVVADGMGGHQGGETASLMVTETVPLIVEQKTKNSKTPLDPKELLAHCIIKANQAIYDRASKQNNLNGMGTTTTAMLFGGNTLSIGHVGDSRCYFFRPGCVWQLTRDHSLVAEKLRAGIITPEEAKHDSMKNVITRSVGFEMDLEVDSYEFEVKVGDVFLLCSDGLTGPVSDEEMSAIMDQHVFQDKNIQKAVQALIDLANANGGDDNISALIVKVTSE